MFDSIPPKMSKNQRGWDIGINCRAVTAFKYGRYIVMRPKLDAPNRLTAALFELAFIAPEIWRDETNKKEAPQEEGR